MTSYVKCRVCAGEMSATDAAIVASQTDIGWLAIVCHACGHVANVKDRDYYEPNEVVVTPSMLGMLAINAEARTKASKRALRIATRAARSHDRAMARKARPRCDV